MQTQAATKAGFGNLVAAIATVACCDIAMGLTLQILPLLMEQQGVAARIMGLNAAMGPIGILLAGPFLPPIIGRFGSRKVVAIVVVIIMAALAGFKLAPSIWVWFPIRFVMGIATGTLFTISEAWVLTFADPRNRGRIMGFYTSVLAITFSVGPLIIPLTGIDGWTPWLIGIICVAVSVLPLGFVKVSDDAFRQKEPGGFFRFVTKAPLLLFAVAAVTLYDNVFISFFTIFGLRSGLGLDVASLILGVAIISNVFLFTPTGMLADRWSRRGVMMITASLTVALSLSLPFVIGSWLIWPATILLSATAFGPYIISLATLGDSFKGADLMAGSAAFSAMWGIGGLFGPPIAGAAIDAFGINAMPVTIAVFHGILLAMLIVSGGRLVRTPAHE